MKEIATSCIRVSDAKVHKKKNENLNSPDCRGNPFLFFLKKRKDWNVKLEQG